MAKGARASSKKSNRTALRARVFGPQEKERLERLAKKQQEIAEGPKPQRAEMQVDEDIAEDKAKDQTDQGVDGLQQEEMDLDTNGVKKQSKSKRKEHRVSKRRHRKVENRMTFPSVKQRRTVSRVSNR